MRPAMRSAILVFISVANYFSFVPSRPTRRIRSNQIGHSFVWRRRRRKAQSNRRVRARRCRHVTHHESNRCDQDAAHVSAESGAIGGFERCGFGRGRVANTIPRDHSLFSVDRAIRGLARAVQGPVAEFLKVWLETVAMELFLSRNLEHHSICFLLIILHE